MKREKCDASWYQGMFIQLQRISLIWHNIKKNRNENKICEFDLHFYIRWQCCQHTHTQTSSRLFCVVSVFYIFCTYLL